MHDIVKHDADHESGSAHARIETEQGEEENAISALGGQRYGVVARNPWERARPAVAAGPPPRQFPAPSAVVIPDNVDPRRMPRWTEKNEAVQRLLVNTNALITAWNTYTGWVDESEDSLAVALNLLMTAPLALRRTHLTLVAVTVVATTTAWRAKGDLLRQVVRESFPVLIVAILGSRYGPEWRQAACASTVGFSHFTTSSPASRAVPGSGADRSRARQSMRPLRDPSCLPIDCKHEGRTVGPRRVPRC